MSSGANFATIFTSNTQHEKSIHFNLMTCRGDTNGHPIISFAAFYMTTDETETNILFAQLHTSKTKLYKSSQKVVLDRE